MKKIFWATLFLVASSGNWLSAQSFEGSIIMKGFEGELATYYLKGEKVRLEIDDEGKTVVVLFTMKGNTVQMLMPDERWYTEMPAINLGDSHESYAGKINKTNETRQIHGYRCEKWVVSDGNHQSELWVTDQLRLDFSSLVNPMVRMVPDDWQHGLSEYFPMSIASINKKGKSETFLEVVSIEKKQLSEELFSIPPGYQKM